MQVEEDGKADQRFELGGDESLLDSNRGVYLADLDTDEGVVLSYDIESGWMLKVRGGYVSFFVVPRGGNHASDRIKGTDEPEISVNGRAIQSLQSGCHLTLRDGKRHVIAGKNHHVITV